MDLEIWQAVGVGVTPLAVLALVYYFEEHKRVSFHWTIFIAIVLCIVFALVSV